MHAVAIGKRDALSADAKRILMPRNMMDLAARVNSLPLALQFGAQKGGADLEFVRASFAVQHLYIADKMHRAWHWRENQGARLQQPINPHRKDRVILIYDGRDADWIGLAGLAGHPVDAVRRIEIEPGFKLAFVQQARFPKDKKLDLDEACRKAASGRLCRHVFQPGLKLHPHRHFACGARDAAIPACAVAVKSA